MELTTDEALQQGIAAHRAGKLEDAEKLYKAILTAHPKHPDANHNLGILAVGVGKLDESVPYFKTALEASPNVEQFWLSYIDTLIKLGHLDGARQVIQQGRGVGLKGAKIDGLEARLGSSLPSSSDPSKDQLDGFVSLYQQGKYEEALVRGKALSEQFPGNAFIPNILGAVHAALGDNEAAVSSYNKAIEIKPDYAEPYNNLGVSLKTLGRHTEAITSYNKAIEIQPDYAEAYYNLGISFSYFQCHKSAINSYLYASNLTPHNHDIYFNLGNSLVCLGKNIEALWRSLTSRTNFSSLGLIWAHCSLSMSRIPKRGSARRLTHGWLSGHSSRWMSIFSSSKRRSSASNTCLLKMFCRYSLAKLIRSCSRPFTGKDSKPKISSNRVKS